MKLNKLMQLLRDNAQARAEGEPSIRADSTDTGAHIYVYDVIDAWWGASAAALIEALAGVGDRLVHLHINSPGGDVFEARAMASAIVAHPGQVITHIDGLAASAATYLALAGNEVRMTEGGLFMVHNSWTLAYGNKAELRSTADLLDKIDSTILADYAKRTGAGADQVRAWMDAETWFTPQEALDAKFIDAIDTNTKRDAGAKDSAAARWNLSAYANAPQLPKPAADEPPLEQLLQAHQHRRNRVTALFGTNRI
jgi:ATP-dependent Clp protease, protease subunit